MVASKTKGQISIEALIIVGVLVIGGVIFASVYLNNLGVHTKRSSELSGLTDGFMNDLSGWNDTPGTPGTGSTPTCSDGTQNQGEIGIDCGGPCPACMTPSTCNNGFQDGLETGTDCGGTCPPCPIPGEFIISLILNPASSSPKNIDFKIHVLMTNTTGQPKEVLKSITIKNNATQMATDKCSFNGVNASSFNNLNIPFNGVREMVLSFSCKEDGNYSFAIEAGILGDTTPEYNDTQNVVKEIKSTAIGCAVSGVCGPTDTCPTCPECCLNPTPKFSIFIISPTEGQAYFNNQSIQLTAQDADTLSRTGVICEWYIGEKYIPASKSCDYSFNLSTIDPGTTKVTVYATKEVNGVTLSSKDEKNIKIYKYDPTAIYLSSPGIQYVGKEFNLKVSSQNQSSVSGVSNTNISFSGTNCIIDSGRVSGVLTEEVGTTMVYYKTFPTTCLQASYSAPETLNPVNAIFSGVSTPFYVGYDLSLNFIACSEGGSNYGQLTSCVLSTAGGNYNSDYWNSSSYGLLKVTVDVASGETTNSYGTLTVYVE